MSISSSSKAKSDSKRNSIASSISSKAESPMDAFEQLMQSGKTMKVSLTPDRLKKMDSTEKLSTAAAAPEPAPPSPKAATPTRRLQARAPNRDQIVEEEDENDEEDLLDDLPPRAKGAKNETLMDLLNSPPPWSENEERFGGPAPVKRRISLKKPWGSPKLNGGGGSQPASAAMEAQGSFQSVTSVGSAFSSGSEVEAWLNQTPEERAKKLQVKAKDELADLASERQINQDLVEMFASEPPSAAKSAPPPAPGPTTPQEDRRQSATPSTTPSKKRQSGILSLIKREKQRDLTRTLLTLRAGMVNAASQEACVALLDQLILDCAEEARQEDGAQQ